MNIKDKIHPEKVDILMYYGLRDLADNKKQKIAEELIPTFIIEEALMYFCDLEKYEICQIIKTFFQNNSTFMVKSSREDWFGLNLRKNQKY